LNFLFNLLPNFLFEFFHFNNKALLPPFLLPDLVVLLLQVNILLLSEQAVSLIHAALAPLLLVVDNTGYFGGIESPDVLVPLRLFLLLLLLFELL